MTQQIDYDRLELIVEGDIHETCRNEFDIPTICQKAVIENGLIVVRTPKFVVKYDLITYRQVFGMEIQNEQ